MGDPLAAAHELVFRVVAERVAHAAMPAADADAVANSRQQRLAGLRFQLAHRPHRDDGGIFIRKSFLQKAFLIVENIRFDAERLQLRDDSVGSLHRVMPVPSAAKNQYLLFHKLIPFFSLSKGIKGMQGIQAKGLSLQSSCP